MQKYIHEILVYEEGRRSHLLSPGGTLSLFYVSLFLYLYLFLTCSLMATRLLLSHGLGEGVEVAAVISRDLTRSLDLIVIWNPLQKRVVVA